MAAWPPRSAISAASTSALIRSAMEGRGLKSSIRTAPRARRRARHLGAVTFQHLLNQGGDIGFGEIAQPLVPTDQVHRLAQPLHHNYNGEAFFIGRSLHGQSFPVASRGERLAVHRAEPAVFARAGFVGVEEAEAARGAQTDGARLEARVPEPNTLRAIRRRERGLDLRGMIHAALRSGSAAVTERRMSRLLNWNEISAGAISGQAVVAPELGRQAVQLLFRRVLLQPALRLEGALVGSHGCSASRRPARDRRCARPRSGAASPCL